MLDYHPGRALLAGMISGTAMSFLITGFATVVLIRNQQLHQVLQKVRIPLPLIGIVLANGLILGGTMLGLLLGFVYIKVKETHPESGLGSPNQFFTLGVIIVVTLLLLSASYVRRRLTVSMCGSALIVIMTFGWLLPTLAR